MPNVLVRNVEEQVLLRLKTRARTHHHALQQELKIILERAAFQYTLVEAAQVTEVFRKKVGKTGSDSVAMLREDRTR